MSQKHSKEKIISFIKEMYKVDDKKAEEMYYDVIYHEYNKDNIHKEIVMEHLQEHECDHLFEYVDIYRLAESLLEDYDYIKDGKCIWYSPIIVPNEE